MYYSTDTPEVVKDVCRNSPDFIIFIRINLDVIRPALFPACLMGNIQALGKARCRPGSQFDAADFRFMLIEPGQRDRKGMVHFAPVEDEVICIHIGGKGPYGDAYR